MRGLRRPEQRFVAFGEAVGSDQTLSAKCAGVPRQLTLVSADTIFKEIVTQTKPSDFPSLLRQKLSTVQTVERHKIQTEATTSETCEKCGRTEVRFSAVQLRGADEGSTIFFTCDCGHKYVLSPQRA